MPNLYLELVGLLTDWLWETLYIAVSRAAMQSRYSHEDVASQGGQQGEGNDEEHGLVASWGAVGLV